MPTSAMTGTVCRRADQRHERSITNVVDWARLAHFHSMFGKKRNDPVEDAWHIYEGSYDGRPLLIRGNVGAKKLIGSKAHRIKVGLAVPFNEPQANGLPHPEEDAQLGAVEETIVEALVGHAVLVAVLTTNGMREFVAYTGDGAWLPAFDQHLQETITTHSVQIDARTDPDWSAYRQFVQ